MTNDKVQIRRIRKALRAQRWNKATPRVRTPRLSGIPRGLANYSPERLTRINLTRGSPPIATDCLDLECNAIEGLSQ